MGVADFRSIASSIGNSLGKGSNGGGSGGDLIPEDYFYNRSNMSSITLCFDGKPSTLETFDITEDTNTITTQGDPMNLHFMFITYKNNIKLGCYFDLQIILNASYEEGGLETTLLLGNLLEGCGIHYGVSGLIQWSIIFELG